MTHVSAYYTVTIVWRDPAWDIDHVVCYKYSDPSLKWIEKEDDILRQHYTQAPHEEGVKVIL